jgi:hypothetical protein
MHQWERRMKLHRVPAVGCREKHDFSRNPRKFRDKGLLLVARAHVFQDRAGVNHVVLTALERKRPAVGFYVAYTGVLSL